MTRWIALFRGINVGGRNIVKMVQLKEMFESLGFDNVKTYIQSGNVVFESTMKNELEIENCINEAFAQTFSFIPKIIFLNEILLKEIQDKNPYTKEDIKHQHFFFLKSPSRTPDLEKLNHYKSESERFELRDLVFYLCAPDGIGRSKLVSKVEKSLGVSVTARNGKTVQKLLSICQN
ncbi:DUF1697 domain-containing protein [bacterium]|nr:DUF1697 domain-containing protein [bacterium]